MAKQRISFHVGKEETEIISAIVKRISIMWAEIGGDYQPIDAHMDLAAVHANGCPLKLRELLKADNLDFAHDVFGIRRHINRKKGKLEDCFLPRYAA